MIEHVSSAPANRPRIWLNVTNSVAWSGRVVGIIRVERSLARALSAICEPGELGFCTWSEHGFEEFRGSPWEAPEESPPPRDPAGDEVDAQVTGRREALRSLALLALSILPGFVSRPLYRLLSRLRRHGAEPAASGAAAAGLGLGGGLPEPAAPLPAAPFESGDVLVSLGIDWKMRYTGRLAAIREHYGVRIVNCVHDLVPILYPHYTRPGIPEVFEDYLRALVGASDLVLCVSRNTEKDFRDFMRASCTGAAADTAVFRHGDDVPRESGAVRDRIAEVAAEVFVLYVSTIERRKNHEVLCRAYQLLAAERRADGVPRLVFAGGIGWGVDDLVDDIRIDPALRDRVTILEDLSDAELLLLYRNALFCVYPSFYEGWGLPVAEALALRKPVLCSDAGSLPEVGGDAVRYLPPWSPRDWAEAIVELAGDESARDGLAERALARHVPGTWEDSAAGIRDAILGLGGSRNPDSGTRPA